MMHELFKSIGELYTTQRLLAAIWLENPVGTNEGRTIRITEGMLLTITDGKIDKYTEPTHKIIACYGTLVSQFELLLVDIKTNQPLILSI